MSLGLVDAVVLGVVEGLTEFLPVSSTGHLTITEGLLGLEVDDPSVTAFTAVIQVGAIAAVLLYFAKDIARFARGFLAGLRSAEGRRTDDWRFTLAVVLGSLPDRRRRPAVPRRHQGPGPAVAGHRRHRAHRLERGHGLRRAARHAGARRGRRDASRTGCVIGLAQCIALVPGVSRSGATISAGLLRGLDRVTATRLSFFLAIPALTAAGVTELPSALDGRRPRPGRWSGRSCRFVVAYASIAFLLRFVASNSIAAFVPYRVALGVVRARDRGCAVTSEPRRAPGVPAQTTSCTAHTRVWRDGELVAEGVPVAGPVRPPRRTRAPSSGWTCCSRRPSTSAC